MGYIRVITYLLTIDPNFQQGIQVLLSPGVVKLQGCRLAFADLPSEAQELLRNLQKTGRHRSDEALRE